MNVSLEAGIGWSGRPTFLCGSIMRLREVLPSYLSILLLCLSPASVWYSSHSVYCLSLIFWHLRQSYLLSSTSCQQINLVRFSGGLDGITISSIVDCSPWEFSGSHRLISWTEFRAWLVDWNFLVVEESFFFFFVCYFVWSILRSAPPMSFLCPFLFRDSKPRPRTSKISFSTSCPHCISPRCYRLVRECAILVLANRNTFHGLAAFLSRYRLTWMRTRTTRQAPIGVLLLSFSPF